jgi:hypothetical protein
MALKNQFFGKNISLHREANTGIYVLSVLAGDWTNHPYERLQVPDTTYEFRFENCSPETMACLRHLDEIIQE